MVASSSLREATGASQASNRACATARLVLSSIGGSSFPAFLTRQRCVQRKSGATETTITPNRLTCASCLFHPISLAHTVHRPYRVPANAHGSFLLILPCMAIHTSVVSLSEARTFLWATIILATSIAAWWTRLGRFSNKWRACPCWQSCCCCHQRCFFSSGQLSRFDGHGVNRIKQKDDCVCNLIRNNRISDQLSFTTHNQLLAAVLYLDFWAFLLAIGDKNRHKRSKDFEVATYDDNTL